MWECESEGETRERQQSGSLEAVSLPPQARCVLVQSGNVDMKRELETAADCGQTWRQSEAKEEQYVFSFRSPSARVFFIFCYFCLLSWLSFVSAFLSAVRRGN